MSEAELLELMQNNASMISDSTLNVATYSFAYIVGAHFAGRSLNRSMSIAVTLVYTLFLLSSLLTINSGMSGYYRLVLESAHLYPDSRILSQSAIDTAGSATQRLVYTFVALGPSLIACGMSIFYMHFYIRRNIKNA